MYVNNILLPKSEALELKNKRLFNRYPSKRSNQRFALGVILKTPQNMKNVKGTRKNTEFSSTLGSEENKADKAKEEAGRAKEEAEKAKSEAEKAKSEAEQAKEEAGRAKEEAEKAKSETGKAKEEAGRAKEEAEKAKEDAEKAKEEAEKAKSETDKAKEDAEKAKEDAEKAKETKIEKEELSKSIQNIVVASRNIHRCMQDEIDLDKLHFWRDQVSKNLGVICSLNETVKAQKNNEVDFIQISDMEIPVNKLAEFPHILILIETELEVLKNDIAESIQNFSRAPSKGICDADKLSECQEQQHKANCAVLNKVLQNLMCRFRNYLSNLNLHFIDPLGEQEYTNLIQHEFESMASIQATPIDVGAMFKNRCTQLARNIGRKYECIGEDDMVSFVTCVVEQYCIEALSEYHLILQNLDNNTQNAKGNCNHPNYELKQHFGRLLKTI